MWITALVGWVIVPLFTTDYAVSFLNPAFLGSREGTRMVLGGVGSLYEQTREAMLYDNFDQFAGWIPVARSRTFGPVHPWVGVSVERSDQGISFQIQPETILQTVDRSRSYAPDYTVVEDQEVRTTQISHRYTLAAGGRIAGGIRAGVEMAYREGVMVVEQIDHRRGDQQTQRQGYRGWDALVGGAWKTPHMTLWVRGQIPFGERGWETPQRGQIGVEFLGAQTFPVFVGLHYFQDRTGGDLTRESWEMVSRQAILDRYLFGVLARAVRENGTSWYPVMGFFTGYQETFWGRLSLVTGAHVEMLPVVDQGTQRIRHSLAQLYLYTVYTFH